MTDGYAFPIVHETTPIRGGDKAYIVERGMTLRDYFAAAALTGMLASETVEDRVNVHSEDYARDCYAHADAMLVARDKAREA